MPEVLIAVAHGSKDPRAAATVGSLMSLVRERAAGTFGGGAGVEVRTAYLGHAAPSLPQVLGAVDPGHRVTVLPLLLTAAYHSKVDVPRVLARHPHLVSYGATLGPHPLLLDALERRLGEAGAEGAGDRASTGVVLAAAGSSDPDANGTIARLAARWHVAGGWHSVLPAFASAAAPAPGEAVTALLRAGARRVVVATYLLAPGFFADRIRDEALAAGAAAVAPVLGAAAEVADVVLDRYLAVSSRDQTAA